MPFSAHCRVGRLVEARLHALSSVDEVDRFQAAMREAFLLAGRKAVVCADWRGAQVLPPDVAERVAAMLVFGNPRLERSAVLLARDSAAFALQVERVVREAANPARRTFRDAADMQAWLSGALDPIERTRMEEFLSESVRR